MEYEGLLRQNLSYLQFFLYIEYPMSMHRTIIRYFLIINRVKQPGYPSLQALSDMLEGHDFNISLRTLQRDLENIRNDFGIEIRYNVHHRGYYIDTEASLEMGSIIRFMEMAVLSGAFSEVYLEGRKVQDYVSFDAEGLVRGVEYLSPILFALRNRRQLSISHQKFGDKKPTTLSVKPGLLKEYQNRWYLVGTRVKGGGIRTFALDRIKAMELEEATFDEKETEGIREMFVHVIGISYPERKPQFIEITVAATQWNYIESLPWHPSQEVLSRDEETVTFRLFVVQNYELEEKILAQGKNIKKINPAWLAEKIQKIKK